MPNLLSRRARPTTQDTKRSAPAASTKAATPPSLTVEALLADIDTRIGDAVARRAAIKREGDTLLEKTDEYQLDALQKKLGDLTEEDKHLKEQLDRLDTMREQVQRKARQEKFARTQAATRAKRKELCAGVMRNVTSTAVMLDQKFEELKEIAREFAMEGELLSNLANDIIAEQTVGDVLAYGDKVVLVEPRVSGRGADVAVALSVHIRELMQIFDSQQLRHLIKIDQFAPVQPDRVVAARKRDAAPLIEWFGEQERQS